MGEARAKAADLEARTAARLERIKEGLRLICDPSRAADCEAWFKTMDERRAAATTTAEGDVAHFTLLVAGPMIEALNDRATAHDEPARIIAQLGHMASVLGHELGKQAMQCITTGSADSEATVTLINGLNFAFAQGIAQHVQSCIDAEKQSGGVH